MKITVTGSLGNISKPLVAQLVGKGNDVIVVSRSRDKISEIEKLGAKAAIGNTTDEDFLIKTFTGSDVVYLMIPPDYQAQDMTAYIADSGKRYADAIQESAVKRIVVLSSMGAHLPLGSGPLSALALAEEHYAKLENVDITYLRPGGFYTNYLATIGLIKHAGIIGDNTAPDSRFLITHPADIADQAADAILNPNVQRQNRFIISAEITNNEIASILGTAIGKPDLQWVRFENDQYSDGLLQNGFSESAAQSFIEMGEAFREGRAWEQVDQQPENVVKGKRSFEDFAKDVFAPAFNQ
ncbi:MAG: NAD-dependent dehydratase [Flavobacterium sp.]|uniref:NAD(P)H-binding protein n=1 Tax=Flavobacterium sp. TaxID=239 RepID=UPI001223EED4|nr:NAD(P)H-binding protein [Flavobacterium sp.]RZJ68411.1 MAG: NAD-dependent dehydratase [Flavobacterium sp.]